MATQWIAVAAAAWTLCLSICGAMADDDGGHQQPATILESGHEFDTGIGSAADIGGDSRCDRTSHGCADSSQERNEFDGCRGCGYCPPALVARVGFLFMDRANLDDTPLINVFRFGVFSEVFGANRLEFDREPGVDTSLSYCLGDAWSVEGRYLWLDDQRATADVSFGSGSQLATQPPLTLSSFTNTDVFFQYDSQMQTAELNLRRDIAPWLTASAGFRYLQLDEGLVMDQFFPPFSFRGIPLPARTALTTIDTRNDLYGFQLGADGALLRGCGLSIDGFVKGGLYNNRATSTAFNRNGSGTLSMASDESDELAFLGEAGLYASHAFNHTWSLRAGYQLMWLSGIAVAGDQLVQTQRPPFQAAFAATTADVEGTAFYHGFHGGLEARW